MAALTRGPCLVALVPQQPLTRVKKPQILILLEPRFSEALMRRLIRDGGEIFFSTRKKEVSGGNLALMRGEQIDGIHVRCLISPIC